MFEQIKNWLAGNGLSGLTLEYVSWATVIAGVIILALAATLITRRVLLTSLSFIIRRTRSQWDDALLERRVLHRAAHVAPALVIYWLAGVFPGWDDLLKRLVLVYMLAVSGGVVIAFGSAVLDVYRTTAVARNRPIKGLIQIVQIIVLLLLAILGLAVLFDQSPFGLLGGLGALTAVLLLIFKDTILGLVASFQISTLNMVRLGDWIEIPKYGADGDVIDISLHTIKVQNWDKTIITIPTYALISESFKNWRGMQESGGRRIKRAINLDMSSIKFCTAEMLDRFSQFQALGDYIEAKRTELETHNRDQKVDAAWLVNGRHLTNVGTFRAYLEEYLRRHPAIHQDMTFLVRQLPPGEHGLPLEIYVFSKIQSWAKYEAVQADIFDHILAILPLFELRVFQSPTGSDFQTLMAGKS